MSFDGILSVFQWNFRIVEEERACTTLNLSTDKEGCLAFYGGVNELEEYGARRLKEELFLSEDLNFLSAPSAGDWWAVL